MPGLWTNSETVEGRLDIRRRRSLWHCVADGLENAWPKVIGIDLGTADSYARSQTLLADAMSTVKTEQLKSLEHFKISSTWQIVKSTNNEVGYIRGGAIEVVQNEAQDATRGCWWIARCQDDHIRIIYA